MNIKSGNDRVAFVGDETTIKVPNPAKLKRLKNGYSWYKHHGMKGFQKWLEFDYEAGDGPRAILLSGIRANRREAELAKEFKDLVLPTRSLFAGFINIQPTVPEMEMDFNELHKTFADHLNQDVVEIGHTLERPGNFGIHEGRIKFIDAGSDRLAKLIHKRRADIEKALRSLGGK